MNCELGQAGTEGLVSVVTGRKEERKESELPWDEDGSVLRGGAGEEEEEEEVIYDGEDLLCVLIFTPRQSV